MNLRSQASVFTSLLLAAALAPAAGPSYAIHRIAMQKEAQMKRHATGTFDVKTTPQPSADAPAAPADPTADPNIARFLLDKHYHGDLEATGTGQMLTAGTATKGSAGYVAMEKVAGTLSGHTGSFVFQHIGVMNRGAFDLSVTIVPDSGTGDLTGISGKLAITIKEGKHFYDLEYTLAPPQ